MGSGRVRTGASRVPARPAVAWVVAALGSGVLALARNRGRDPVAQLGQ